MMDDNASSLASETIAITTNNDLDGITEDEFYGLDVYDSPPTQLDDELYYLHEKDISEIRQSNTTTTTTPTRAPLNWTDNLISTEGEPVLFNLDQAVKEGWENLEEEVAFLKANLKEMCQKPAEEEVAAEDIFHLSLGKTSSFSTCFCKELGVDYDTYCRFMSNMCVQMAYHDSPTGMYEKSLLLLADSLK